jgi:glyoxylase-like metal-dependent hydrolase (beta-lactamase superfamily II)
MSEDDVYTVYAIRYGRHDRRSPVNYIGGDPHDILQPLDYYIWAIVGTQTTFVLDTGFDRAMGAKRDRAIIKPIDEGLKAIGIDSGAVEHVIISHLHFDHAGNYDLFPRARYHLQDCEMGYATGRSMCHEQLRMPFEADDVAAMVRKVFADRVQFHDGTGELAPGITVHLVGGHSRGLQCVRVKTRRGFVVLAADATHLYNHFEERRVYPIVDNVALVLEGYDLLERLATSRQHVIPGHDPAVLDRYPAARAGLQDWVVRLDAEPRRS